MVDWSKLYNGLVKVGICLKTQCKIWEEKDKDGNTVKLSVFIPWHLTSLINVADVQTLLPEGWEAKESTRDSDMREALHQKKDYTPSIVIQQGANALDALNSFTSK